LLCSSLQSLRSLPLSFGGDSLLPKLNNCYSLQPLRTVFGVSRVGCSRYSFEVGEMLNGACFRRTLAPS